MFRSELCFGELFLDDLEEFQTGTWVPAVLTGVFGVGRNPTIFVEAAKVIDPDHIIELEAGPQAGEPPGVTILGVAFPCVKGITPELPIGCEIVGRNPSDAGWFKIFRHLEKLRVSPDFSTIHGDENRDIAENLDLPVGRVPSQFVPLLEKLELIKSVSGNLVFELFGWR